MPVQISLDTKPLEQAVAKLQNRSKALPFMKVWSAAAVSAIGEAAVGKQGEKGRFWAAIAQAVRLVSVSENSAAIEGDYRGAHKETGGEIRAKNKRALTIPLPSAKGKDAAWWEGKKGRLFTIQSSKGNTLLGYATPKQKKFTPLYWLATRVNQKAEPWMPKSAEIYALGETIAGNQFKTWIGGA